MRSVDRSHRALPGVRQGMTMGVVLGAVAVLLMSCSEEPETRTCLTIECHDTLTLHLEAEHWVPGEYVVSITDSGRGFECRFEMEAGGSGGQAGSADQLLASTDGCTQVSGDDVENWQLPRLYLESEGRFTIEVLTAAKEVPVSVRRGDTSLIEEVVTPSYSESSPGGPDCGVCLSATEELTVPVEAG